MPTATSMPTAASILADLKSKGKEGTRKIYARHGMDPARVYGVSMSYFFAEPARHTLSITRKAHLQGDGRGVDSLKVTPLNAEGVGFRLIAQVVEFPPDGANVAINAFQETGAFVYVLEGRLRLDFGGMHDVLETGDCACMESEMPLAWSAADKHRCCVLAVLPVARP